MSAKLKHVYAPVPRTERGKPVHIGVGKWKKQVSKLVYCNGKQVIVRDLNNPLDAWMYEEHKHDTTVARIAPSGFYIASADVSGRIVVWDCVGEDRVIKLDKASIGSIVDMAWSDDSKRIAVGGQGREKFAEAFFMDGGASVGDVSGHTKPITTIDLKQTRPYRLATGSEDFHMGWYEGPPFKFKKLNSDHSRYVNCLRFSPDGNKVVTVGSDKKGFIYDGKEGTKLGELSETNGHSGSIYSVAWSPDSSKFVTASVDKSVKVWDGEGKVLGTFSCFGNDVNDQQLGCVWQDNTIVSVALNGTLTLLDDNNFGQAKKVILGHNKIISALAYNTSGNRAYTADVSGYIVEWNPDNGDTRAFTGAPHSSLIKHMVVNAGKLITVSIDDTVKITPLDSLQYGDGIALGAQPCSVASVQDVTVVATSGGIVVLQGSQIVHKHEVKYQPTAIAIHPDATKVAVGGKDNKIYLYQLNGGHLKEEAVLEQHRGEITCLAYSHNGEYLGAGDGNREVIVWKGKEAKTTGWVFHASRVQAIAWAPDNEHLATGSVDSAVIVWSVNQPPTKRVHIKLAHIGGVRSVAFTDGSTVLSVGEDCAMKSWSLTY